MASVYRSDRLKHRPPALSSHWYALRTRSRHEKLVDRLLGESGFRTFLPLATKRSRVSLRRFREAELPLFPGYTFVRFAPFRESLRAIRATSGVAEIVGNRSGPVYVPDAEIESVEALLARDVAWQPGARLTAGQSVVVTGGPLRGLRGEIVRRRNRRFFVVKIRLIQRCLEVELNPDDLQSVAPSR